MRPGNGQAKDAVYHQYHHLSRSRVIRWPGIEPQCGDIPQITDCPDGQPEHESSQRSRSRQESTDQAVHHPAHRPIAKMGSYPDDGKGTVGPVRQEPCAPGDVGADLHRRQGVEEVESLTDQDRNGHRDRPDNAGQCPSYELMPDARGFHGFGYQSTGFPTIITISISCAASAGPHAPMFMGGSTPSPGKEGNDFLRKPVHGVLSIGHSRERHDEVVEPQIQLGLGTFPNLLWRPHDRAFGVFLERCFAPGFSGSLDRIIVGADRMGAQAC